MDAFRIRKSLSFAGYYASIIRFLGSLHQVRIARLLFATLGPETKICFPITKFFSFNALQCLFADLVVSDLYHKHPLPGILRITIPIHMNPSYHVYLFKQSNLFMNSTRGCRNQVCKSRIDCCNTSQWCLKKLRKSNNN